jgi:hypothetical protein
MILVFQMMNKTQAHLSLSGSSMEKSPDQIRSRHSVYWIIKNYNPGPPGKAGTHWISFVNTLREVY